MNKNPIVEIIKKNNQLLNHLKPGDLIEGVIVKKEGNRKLYLDLDRYGLGVIYGGELLNIKEEVRNLKIGDKLLTKVIDPDNEEGYVELSLTEASKQKNWEEIMDLKEQEAVITIIPKSFNKGGLVAEINGLSAFLPVSQLSNEHYPSSFVEEHKSKIDEVLEGLIGKEINVKIIDVNYRQKKIILSEKEALTKNNQELFKNYQIGQIIDGVVSGMTDFGVFVKFTDNLEVEGLITLSELSYKIIDNPKEVLKIDQNIKAKIIDIKDKIYLSLKALLPDPWVKVFDYFKENELVRGKVYKHYPFGTIVDLNNDFQGQVHITEFGNVEEMKKQLKIGEVYDFLIEKIQPQERKIILKFKK